MSEQNICTKSCTKYGLIAVILIALGTGGSWVWCWFQTGRALTKSQGQLQKGFAALAAETLDPYRQMLVKKTGGCEAMVAAYFHARKVDRLDWSAQACLEAEKKSPEVYIGLAAAKELLGRDGEALQILAQAAPQFNETPDIFFRMAQIFQRQNRPNEAIAAYMKVIERASNNSSLALEILQYVVAQQRWGEAFQIANRLKSVQTDNPEVKLYVARALLRGGDAAGAQALVADAKTAMEKPGFANKPALEKAYADVLTGKIQDDKGKKISKN